jgi:FRG domain
MKLSGGPITSTEQFVRKVFGVTKAKSGERFYRGHSKSTFKLVPRVLRYSFYRKNEDRLFREMLIMSPADFADDHSTLDKLVRMQHHSLPTRLLDITSNPLMGLYFACKGHSKYEGQVVILTVARDDIKFYDSDTASCLANLAKLSSDYKGQIDTSLSKKVFNDTHPIPMLLHFIKEEKPYFLPIINPSDIGRVICIRTKFDNTRIASQSGASLLFGLRAKLPENGTKEIRIHRISIPGRAKQGILMELDALNINERTVFPYIESSAKYLAAKYRNNRKR